jgi:hypothetical protein
MSDTRRYNLRMDSSVADFYDELAQSQGLKTPVLFREILTNHMHTIAIKTQVDRFENLIEDFEVRLNKKIDSMNNNSKFHEHFGTIYMLLMWMAREAKISEADLRMVLASGRRIARELNENK